MRRVTLATALVAFVLVSCASDDDLATPGVTAPSPTLAACGAARPAWFPA